MGVTGVEPYIEEDEGSALVFCQKWKNGRGKPTPAGFTLHVDKQRWQNFMTSRSRCCKSIERSKKDPLFNDLESRTRLFHMGVTNLVPDGNPYWCEVSTEAKKHIGFGQKFDGIAPLPRYIYRWEPRMRKAMGRITVYAIPRLKSAFYDRNCAEVLILGDALRNNRSTKEYTIEKIAGLGTNACADWSAELMMVGGE